MYIKYLIFPLIFLAGGYAGAQSFFPPVKNYGTMHYGRQFAPENFAITQSDEGLIYTGNIGNVLEFDGDQWRSIPVVNTKPVRSLFKSSNGEIYVGTFGDFGLLIPDSIGQLNYTSLLNNFEGSYIEFTDVWSIIETPSHIYFNAQEQIFQFTGTELKALPMPSTVHTAFLWNDLLLARMRGHGLMLYKDQQWKKLEGSEAFQEYGLFGLIEYENESLLITQELGIWKIDSSNKLQSTDIIDHNDYLNAAIFGAISLPDELIALKTYNQGIIVIDKAGQEIGRINKRTGLNSDEVTNIYLDEDHNLWMTLGNGMAVANIQSSLSFFNETNGLFGRVQAIFEYKNNHEEILLVGTNEGLFLSGKNNSSHLAFQQFQEVTQGVWDIKAVGNTIIVASSEGLFSFPKDFSSPPKLLDRNPVNVLLVDEQREIIITSGSKGTQVLSTKTLSTIYFVEGTFTTTTGIAKNELDNGNTEYWLGLHGHGLLKLTIKQENRWSEEFIFGTDIGIPEDHILVPLKLNNRLYFGSTSGLLSGETIDVDGESFFFISNEMLCDSTITSAIFAGIDTKDNIWTVINNQLGYFDKSSNEYHNRPFWGINYGRINRLYPSKSDYLWIGAAEGLIRYQLNKPVNEKVNFTTLIRSVASMNGDTLFLGAKSSQLTIPIINYSKNGISIHYSAPYFETLNEQN